MLPLVMGSDRHVSGCVAVRTSDGEKDPGGRQVSGENVEGLDVETGD
jgi:hypothetical protein